MDLKFSKVLRSFFPQGKAWEIKNNFSDLVDGMSIEFGRAYDTSSEFQKNFNIIYSYMLAVEHSEDYLIRQGIYTNQELQRIIVEYLNGDLNFKDIIEDFATFTSIPISWEKAPGAFEFGVFEFGNEFGDPAIEQNMQLIIKFADDVTCQEFTKITYLVEFLAPPYLEIFYTNKPAEALIEFEFGTWEFGSGFGDITTCA